MEDMLVFLEEKDKKYSLLSLDQKVIKCYVLASVRKQPRHPVFNQSEALLRSGLWHVIRQYGISARVPQTSRGGETSGGVAR